MIALNLDQIYDLEAAVFNAQTLMSDLFVCAGVDWYARRMRNGLDFERDEEGNVVFNPRVQPFDYSRGRQQLYSYYMFSLKKII